MGQACMYGLIHGRENKVSKLACGEIETSRKIRTCHSQAIRKPPLLMLSVDFKKVTRSEETVAKGGEERIHEQEKYRYVDAYVLLNLLTPARLRVRAKDGLLT